MAIPPDEVNAPYARLGATTGRRVREDGSIHNEADWSAFQERYSLAKQSIGNGAVEVSKRTQKASGDNTLYYALNIPAGRRLLEFSRTIEIIGEGVYNIDVVTTQNGFTGGTPLFKLRLSRVPVGTPDTVTTDIIANVTPIGAVTVVAELSTLDTGVGLGGSRPGGASSSDSVLKGFVGNDALLRITRTGTNNAWTATFNGVYWEEDI